MEKWLTQYLENYHERSEESQQLEHLIKTNYKDISYVPWATMERLMLTQDPSAETTVVETRDGDLVWTSEREIVTLNQKEDSTINSRVTVFSHMVIVKATFLGKTMFEYYPVQDNSWKPVKVIDQNLVNKALQRAKAKVISRVTGIALKLYEQLDLQFEDDTKVKETPKVEKKSKSRQEVSTEVKITDTAPKQHLLEIAKEIQGNEEFTKPLQSFNPTLLKNYGWTISVDEMPESIALKLEQMNNADKFLTALKNKVGK